MALISCQKNRGKSIDITMLDGAGATITAGASDKIRVVVGWVGKLGADLENAKLVVTSDAATDNGSTYTKNSPVSGKNRLRLDASDLNAIPAGLYTLFVDYYDNADGQEWKQVDRQVMMIEET